MRILLTGGSGFIGTILMRHLLATYESVQIINIDLKVAPIVDDRIETMQVDIRNSDIAKLDISGVFDACIHLAALCKEPGYEWEAYFETNHAGTVNVIGLAERLGVPRIIFTSTMMVYRAGEARRTEASETAPDTAYGISKLVAEKELLAWCAKDANRNLTIIRPAVVFGENENANFTRLYQSIKRGIFPYVGKSSTIKANIYVKELAFFIDFILQKRAHESIYNFAFPIPYTMKAIVAHFKDVFKLRSIHPVLPMQLLLWFSYVLELLNQIGLKNGIHHRRIEKLFYSTDIVPANALRDGYVFAYDLRSALEDWKLSADPNL